MGGGSRFGSATVVAILAVGVSVLVGRNHDQLKRLTVGDNLFLHRQLTDGWMMWDDSTTPIPISYAAYLTKFILQGNKEQLPSSLGQVTAKNGYDTVSISKAWDFIRSNRLQKLKKLCSGEGEAKCRAAVNSADKRFKLTPLHLALYSRDKSTADFLMELGGDPSVMDSAGRKPLNLTFENFVTNSRRFAQADGRSCEIPEVIADEKGEWKKEVRRLVREGEPVMIRGVARHVKFSLDDMVNKYGDRPVRVGAVPYADYFGMNIKHLTLREFVEQSVQGDDGGQLPMYVFAKERDINADGFDLLSGIVEESFPVPEMFTDPQKIGPSALHFALGRDGSGAPMHIHSDALNLVLAGEKRWFVLPPQDAIYSRKHISDWVRDDLERTNPRPLECVQGPGDAVYVPFDWGHGVINRGRFTFAYALELLSERDSLMVFK
eukprot:Plantae.Rhodophyta-Purpureofilum_apyrenoidigerum.ctg9785.p1 GENE.Plantae.Rhodophyta-Purpureofilum_apyrenoidigerum.ctg9785~~Plantae.Rhodophyta-Purpureofilum_apyrenoidigerum.ctg9785.p1  ORF type:complete len:458 (-),score=68.07 Plantae.Rhodophyta-Purpureofilum_apyrenoidigerum.ctg9785:413-1717(-)